MGKLTVSMVMFNSYAKLPEGNVGITMSCLPPITGNGLYMLIPTIELVMKGGMIYYCDTPHSSISINSITMENHRTDELGDTCLIARR